MVVCAGSKLDILLSSHSSGCDNHTSMLAQAFERRSGPEKVVPLKRRLCSISLSNMPVQTSSPPLPASFPSFMSVFGGMPTLRTGRREEGVAAHPLGRPSPATVTTTSKPSLPLPHRQSISSVASESTDSSPTTTVSTFDSTSATETSPSSSPESPSSMPLYPKLVSLAHIDADKHASSAPPSAPTQPAPNASTAAAARAESPGRRARNLKNLSLKVPPPSSSRPTIVTASVMETTSSHLLSAPPSPFEAPTKPARRKPAHLTIRTPRLEKSFSNDATDMVPPTPRIRSLRHTESSPSLASICSPTTAPPGGMQLPRPATQHGTGTMPGAWQDDFSSSQIVCKEILHDLVEEDDHLDSRESTRKHERGYPDGPIRIYDSGVYLYLEPTEEEASRFDVVVNVAKEVANPFTKSSDTVMSTWRNTPSDSTRQSAVEPETAMSDTSFKSALEYLPAGQDPPTTAKADRAAPEYIHVGWDHNSEILDDLYPLCELIDDRVSKGKTVLIHCQLGVSRSASLVIAYGLYKNRDLDFNAMYGIVKGRSCWVGPNMSLIYQLTDFRSRVLRGGPSKPAPAEWFVSGGSQPTETSPPVQETLPQPAAPEPSSGADSRGDGPTLPTATASRKRSVSPRPLPLREAYQSVDPPRHRPVDVPGIRKTEFVRHPSVHREHFLKDLPPTPSLFSPRAAGFMAIPFSLGDLAGDGLSGPMRFGQDASDPRSPPQRNEPIIMRNIDEFL
ncbi:hypothetical protein VTN02DRAFT_6026 [Thermoascus thermophilus]